MIERGEFARLAQNAAVPIWADLKRLLV